VLRNDDPDVAAFLAGLGGGSTSNSLVRFRGEWFSTSVQLGSNALPSELVRTIGRGHAGHQRFRDGNGVLQLAVGVPLPAVDASYFEVFPLTELNRTLELLGRALFVSGLLSAVAAALVGRASANRLVKPLTPIAEAAERIAGGALDTRLEPSDPDLDRLADAFNSMAAALEARIEREARFAADVSHELRSPLTAVAAAVEIIERRRDQLPDQVSEAFTVLSQKISGFQRMVLDLLEISRLDAGNANTELDRIDTRDFVALLAADHGVAADCVEVDPAVPTHFVGDRRRLNQALGNVIDNAANYAGGVTAIRVEPSGPNGLRFVFDDRGPGVSETERDAIFARFARGTSGLEKGSSTGTGLGLALVAEHVRLHEGRVWVEDNPGGGARFVIELPEGRHADA
jgi:two-component system sensor histidine kinase MtrB